MELWCEPRAFGVLPRAAITPRGDRMARAPCSVAGPVRATTAWTSTHRPGSALAHRRAAHLDAALVLHAAGGVAQLHHVAAGPGQPLGLRAAADFARISRRLPICRPT